MQHSKIIKKKEIKFKYSAKGYEFAILFFKNFFLTLLSLGLYYPWARVEILKYHYQYTQLKDSSFSFTGTGKEVFKSFIKIYLILFALYLFLILSINSNFSILFISIFYLFIILITPFIIHGTVRYQSSKSSWKGVYFKYLGDKIEFFWKYIYGIILSFFTLGIYTSWFIVDIKKYITSHLRFGNLSFDFKGKGETLFWINLKMYLLIIPTLGIYFFWYQKNLLQFYIKNIQITQNSKTIPFNFKIRTGDVFELIVINCILFFLSLGLATPWIIVRNFKFVFKFLNIEQGLDINNIQKVNYDNDSSKNNLLSFLDLNLL